MKVIIGDKLIDTDFIVSIIPEYSYSSKPETLFGFNVLTVGGTWFNFWQNEFKDQLRVQQVYKQLLELWEPQNRFKSLTKQGEAIFNRSLL